MALGIFGYPLSQIQWLLFSAVPAGNCNGSSFNNAGNNANFWSSTENSSYRAYSRHLDNNSAYVGRSGESKYYGRLVRCLRD